MSRVILRRTNAATTTTDVVVARVRELRGSKVIHAGGDTLLVDVEPSDVDALRAELPGWIVAPQTETIAVPDTRRGVR